MYEDNYLDYSPGKVVVRNMPDNADPEQFIESLGYRVSDCAYMVYDSIDLDIKL